MSSQELPTWVRKRDGRLVPFEADKISQALFAATEALGQANAFLARELTDGILHFLSQEAAEANPSTQQIADLAVKVTRELGYPEVASAFLRRRAAAAMASPKTPRHYYVSFSADDRLAALTARARRQYVRRAVYTRDLVSAMEDGLLHGCLRGRPETIAALAVEPTRTDLPVDEAVLERMIEVHPWLDTFVLDGPDYWVEQPGAWLSKLDLFLRTARRKAILNLRVATPPLWAEAPAAGPLFSAVSAHAQGSRGADEFLDACAALPRLTDRVELRLHVDAANTSDLSAQPRGKARAGVSWTIDRPDHPIALGPGVRRGQPACLMDIGLDLPRFLRLPAINGRVDLFVDKLPSLAGMALSVAAQKRSFLARRLPRDSFLRHGFLLHRAQPRLVPLGLAEVVRVLLGQTPEQSEASRDLTRLIVRTLKESATRQGLQRNIEPILAIDWPQQTGLGPPRALLETAELLAQAGVEVTADLAGAEGDSGFVEIARKTALDRITFGQ